MIGRRLRSPGGPRRGGILVFVALLFLVLLGLAAVVIDLGIVRATQLQLQASADAASLEGLRGRDADIADPTERDLARRTSAARFAALVFDEDTDLTTAPNEYFLGAGPTLSTGVGGINDPAGGILETDGPYIPLLQTNVDNFQQGDLVSGTYAALDPAAPERNDWHDEASTYLRNDFTVDDAADAPSFLARTRRTRDTLGLDRQPGVSSSGPTLPYLFGLGSGVLSTETPEVYDPRRDGITVRATSIADARPAVAAGIATSTLPGLAPIAFDLVDPTARRWLSFDQIVWSNLLGGSAVLVDVLPNGTVVGVAGGPSEALFGEVLRVLDQDGGRVGDLAFSGDVAAPDVSTPVPLGRLYVGIHVPATGPGPEPRFLVRGFAALRLDSTEVITGPSGDVLRLTGVKVPSIIAPANASAVLATAADPASVTPPLPGTEPLLAPVLAR
ncbi:MAG: pilus assembly protein TadG-related protein [Planctomycetota bacterium]